MNKIMFFMNHLGPLWSQLFAPLISSFQWASILLKKGRRCKWALVLSLNLDKISKSSWNFWELKLLSIQANTAFSLKTNLDLSRIQEALETWLKPIPHLPHVLGAPATLNYYSYCIGPTHSVRLPKLHHLCSLLRSPFPSPFLLLGRLIYLSFKTSWYHFLCEVLPHLRLRCSHFFLNTPTIRAQLRLLWPNQ